MIAGSQKRLKIKGKLSELMMLQLLNESEHFLEKDEKERQYILEYCKNKVLIYNMFRECLNNIIHSQYKDKRVGFLEIIKNAIDSMHFDGGEISIKINPFKNEYEFSISDSGHGMTTKELLLFLTIPFKSTRKDQYKEPYYGGNGIGFQSIMNLSNNVRVITSSGEGIGEIELKKNKGDWDYTLITREGKITGTTVIGNFKTNYDKGVYEYIKKYFLFVNPDKYKIFLNGEKINIGKTIYKNTVYKSTVQKNNIKSNLFLYSIKDGNATFYIYRKGCYVKDFKETLKTFPIINEIIEAMMNECDYSYVIEIPEIIELTGTNDDFFIDDKTNIENSIRKMLEAYILSDILSVENIIRRIEAYLIPIYEKIFKEMLNIKTNEKTSPYYEDKYLNISTNKETSHLYKKLLSTKFVNVLQLSSSTLAPKKVKMNPEELYQAIKKRKIQFTHKMDKAKTGLFIEDDNPIFKALKNIDNSFNNLVKSLRRTDEKQEQNAITVNDKNYQGNILQRTSLNVLEKIMNLEKKGGAYVVFIRFIKFLDAKISNIIEIPPSNITIHAGITINNDEIAITDEKGISFNISNKNISTFCDILLKKTITPIDIMKIIDILIHEKAHIVNNYYSKSDTHSVKFYENVKTSIRNKIAEEFLNQKIDLTAEINKMIKSRTFIDKTKPKDLIKLIKKHSNNIKW